MALCITVNATLTLSIQDVAERFTDTHTQLRYEARAMATWVLLTNDGAPSEDSYKVFIHCLRMAHLATMGAKLN